MSDPAKIVRAVHLREVDEARQNEIDDALSELHDVVDRLERRRYALDAQIERRERKTRESDGPDPVEVIATAIHRAVHGDAEPKPEALDRLRSYARAVVVDLSSAGYLTIPATAEAINGEQT